MHFWSARPQFGQNAAQVLPLSNLCLLPSTLCYAGRLYSYAILEQIPPLNPDGNNLEFVSLGVLQLQRNINIP